MSIPSISVTCSLLFLSTSLAGAQEKGPLDFVPTDAYAFVDVRWSEINKSEVAKLFTERMRRRVEWELGFFLDQTPDRSVTVFLEPRDLLATLAGRGAVPLARRTELRLDALDTKELANGGGISIQTFAKTPPVPPKAGTPALGWSKSTYQGHDVHRLFLGDFWVVPLDGTTTAMTRSASAVKRFLDAKVHDKGPLASALSRARKDGGQIFLGVNGRLLSKEARRDLLLSLEAGSVFQAVLGKLIQPLLEFESLYARGDIAAKLTLEGEMTFATPEQARVAEDSIRDGLVLLRRLAVPAWRRGLHDSETMDESELGVAFVLLEQLGLAGRGARVTRDKNRIELVMQSPTELAALKTAIDEATKELERDAKAVEVRLRRESREKIWRIGVAMHEFHDVHKRLPPPAICDKTGKPLLSWRVALLPYVGQEALYRDFKLDEPWDSPANLECLDRMPPVYAAPIKTKDKNVTYYQVFTGDRTMFPFLKNAKSAFGAISPRLTSIADGTAATFMLAEAAQPVPWTKPEDMPYDHNPKAPLPTLGGIFRDGFHVVFGDVVVLFVRRTVSPRNLRAGIDAADGLPFDQLDGR